MELDLADQPRSSDDPFATGAHAGELKWPLGMRVLVWLLALDVAGGLWLHAHTGWLSETLLAQVPLLGVLGLVWGIVPDARKDSWGAAAVGSLERPAMLWVLRVLFVVAVVGSLTCSTVRVTATDPDQPATRLAMQTDPAIKPDSLLKDPSDSWRLSRTTSPQLLPVRLLVRRTVTVFPPSHVRPCMSVWAWLPARLNYPDDFEPMATLAIVLDVTAQAKLRPTATDTTRARIASRFELMEDSLGERIVGRVDLDRDTLGTLISFLPPTCLGSRVERWPAKEMNPSAAPACFDPASRGRLTAALSATSAPEEAKRNADEFFGRPWTTARADRPLLQQEVLYWRWIVRDTALVGPARVTLEHPLT